MTEWEVVGVIIALVGLLAAAIKPIVSLTRSIAELTSAVKDLREDMAEQRASAKSSHQRLWEHNTRQDEQIQDHESRISVLERK